MPSPHVYRGSQTKISMEPPARDWRDVRPRGGQPPPLCHVHQHHLDAASWGVGSFWAPWGPPATHDGCGRRGRLVFMNGAAACSPTAAAPAAAPALCPVKVIIPDPQAALGVPWPRREG